MPGRGVRALIEFCNIELTISRRMAAPSRVWQEKGIEFRKASRQHVCLTSTTSFSFSTNFEASSIGDRPNLKVPSGFDALPRKVKTSPLVSIPLTPVPLIFSKSVTVCSKSRRCTEGKRGRECSALRATVLWSTEKCGQLGSSKVLRIFWLTTSEARDWRRARWDARSRSSWNNFYRSHSKWKLYKSRPTSLQVILSNRFPRPTAPYIVVIPSFS